MYWFAIYSTHVRMVKFIINNKKMNTIEQIKQELIVFGEKHNACEEGLEAIKGDSLTELFENISNHIAWCKWYNNKAKEFNNIFDNELVIENEMLLCNCSNEISIVIPNSVTSIGDRAFYNCRGLTSVDIPNSVTSIGKWVFVDCRGLTSVVIPNSVISTSRWAFYDCNDNLKIIRK